MTIILLFLTIFNNILTLIDNLFSVLQSICLGRTIRIIRERKAKHVCTLSVLVGSSLRMVVVGVLIKRKFIVCFLPGRLLVNVLHELIEFVLICWIFGWYKLNNCFYCSSLSFFLGCYSRASLNV